MDTSTSTDAAPTEKESQPLPAAEATPPAKIPTTLAKDDTSVVDSPKHQREDGVEEETEEFFDCQSEPESEPEYASSDSDGEDRYLLLGATVS